MAWKYDKNGKAKRSVRCGFCGEIGHNRASCPKYKEKMAKTLEYHEQAAQDETIQQRMRDYHAEQARMCARIIARDSKTKKGKERRCGFCGEYGHTRRTCQKRKDMVKDETDKAIRFRKHLRDQFILRGIGPGALVEVDASNAVAWGREDEFRSVLAIVTDISFSGVSSRHAPKSDQYWYDQTPICLEVSYVKDVPKRWSDDTRGDWIRISHDMCNFEDVSLEGVQFSSQYGNWLTKVISPVEVSEDILPAQDIDFDHVSDVILDSIVDPK